MLRDKWNSFHVLLLKPQWLYLMRKAKERDVSMAAVLRDLIDAELEDERNVNYAIDGRGTETVQSAG